MRIFPSSDYCLIEPEEKAKKSSGGIFLPDTHDERKQVSIGKILEVGPGRFAEHHHRLIPMWAKVGMRVVYASFHVTDVEIEDRKLVMCKEDGLLCCLAEDEKQPLTVEDIDEIARMTMPGPDPSAGLMKEAVDRQSPVAAILAEPAPVVSNEALSS